MSEQPEALRLAEWLEGSDKATDELAAAELRRLHEFAESEGRWASDYLKRAVHAETEAASLRDQNSELDRKLAEMEDAGRQALEALGLVVWTNNPPVNAAIAALRERLAREEPTGKQSLQVEEPCDKDPRGCWNVRCQLGKVCIKPKEKNAS